LLSTKKAAKSTPLLIMLPILTFAFHKYCKSRFEPAFRKYPVEVCDVNVQCIRPILQVTIPVSNINKNKLRFGDIKYKRSYLKNNNISNLN